MAKILFKSFGVPFAKTTGRAWPVPGEPKVFGYTRLDGAVVGNGATAFHAVRQGGERWHAGVDLPCFPGDRVVAMEPGRIVGTAIGYVKLGAVVVAHPSVVAVYAEVDLDSLGKAGLKPGDAVAAGQMIAFGALNYEERSMLHVELWTKDHAPKGFTPWYTSAPAPPAGLLDPTAYLWTLGQGKPASTGRPSLPASVILGVVAAIGITMIAGRKA